MIKCVLLDGTEIGILSLKEINEKGFGEQIKEINCNDSRLKTLEGIEQCVNLRKLYCGCNKLGTLKWIENCAMLQILYCYKNQLETLEELEGWHNLHRNSKNFKENVVFKTVNSLNLFVQLGKEIHSISSLETKFYRNFVSLQILDCSFNQLKTLEGLGQCAILRKLNCVGNKLETLEGLEKCINLRELYCSYNQLKTLKGIEKCVNLFVQLGKEIHSISSLETKFYRNFVSLQIFRLCE